MAVLHVSTSYRFRENILIARGGETVVLWSVSPSMYRVNCNQCPASRNLQGESVRELVIVLQGSGHNIIN